jgi:transposase
LSTKIHLRSDGLGLPIAIAPSPGKVSDRKGFEPIMAESGPEPEVLMADKGYDSDAIRNALVGQKIYSVIPPRRNRLISFEINGPIYALRNLIEWCFVKLKHSRRLATRYDKTSISYAAFVFILSARLRVRYFANTA